MGYCVDVEKRSVGISDRCASWICRWIDETINAGSLRMHDFADVLGRLNFAMEAIDQLCPFLGPLYAWSAAMYDLRLRRRKNLRSRSVV